MNSFYVERPEDGATLELPQLVLGTPPATVHMLRLKHDYTRSCSGIAVYQARGICELRCGDHTRRFLVWARSDGEPKEPSVWTQAYWRGISELIDLLADIGAFGESPWA